MMNDEEKIARASRGLTSWIRALIKLRMIRVWCDGDTISFTWIWYNPLFLLVLPFLIGFIIAVGFLEGFPFVWYNLDFVGIGLSEYWKEKRGDRLFITPDML